MVRNGKEIIELISSIESGDNSWEESGFLEGPDINGTKREELTKLYDACIPFLVSESDDEIQQCLLPCIRRIYTGIYKHVITEPKIPLYIGENVAFIFSDPSVIHNMLTSKYRVLKAGMDVLECTDTQAESVSLLCDDYIRGVKEMIRRDADKVIKIVNRELNLDQILNKC